VRVAGQALSASTTFDTRDAVSSNTDIVQASATGAADVGNFDVSVQQLAQALQISSDPNNVFTDADQALNLDGTIRINGTNITIRDTDSLRDIASRISNADAGVSATVLDIGSGQFRLSVRSLETGANGFTLADVSTSNILESLRIGQNQSSDTIVHPITDGAASNEFSLSLSPVATELGLDSNVPSGTVQISNGTGSINVTVDLATQSLEDIAQNINNAASTAGSTISATVNEVRTGVFQLEITTGDGTTPTFVDSGNVLETLGVVKTSFVQVDQQGLDSQFKVNGIDVVRSSNTVSDVIDNVTLTLVSDANPTQSATVSISRSSTGATDAVQGFIDSFNSTKGFIQQFASFDPETKQAGVLLGDASVLSVDQTLSNTLVRAISTLPSQRLDSLNSGSGVASGSIQITDRSGATATIDLTSADTVQDVIDTINLNPDVQVEASINRDGTGLVLEDNSGGTGSLTVAESGSTTAADLGILDTSPGGTIQGSAVAQAEFVSLAQLGVGVNTDGTLSLDTTTFQSFLDNNPDMVKAFFTQKGGFGDIVVEAADQLTDTRTGILTTEATSLQTTIDDFNSSISRIEESVTRAEENLRRQFTALEQSLAQLQQQSTFITNQLSQLGSSGGSGGSGGSGLGIG